MPHHMKIIIFFSQYLFIIEDRSSNKLSEQLTINLFVICQLNKCLISTGTIFYHFIFSSLILPYALNAVQCGRDRPRLSIEIFKPEHWLGHLPKLVC